MKYKNIIAASILAVASVAAIATPASTPIALTASDLGYSGSFSGNRPTNYFSFDLTGLPGILSVFLQATANSTNGSGYNISTATLDGVSFDALLNSNPTGKFKSTSDNWEYSFDNISDGIHNIVISGNSYKGQSFTGSIGVDSTPITPVPEPESYVMMLAGVGLVGTLALRRKSK